MRKTLLACVLALAACSTPVNPTLIQDGQLAITILKTIDAAAGQEPGVGPSDIARIDLGLTAVQTGLTALQNGVKTPQQFADLATTEINALAPTLLNDFKANASIRTGVVLLQGLLPVIAAEVAASQGPPAAAVSLDDPRAAARHWANTHK